MAVLGACRVHGVLVSWEGSEAVAPFVASLLAGFPRDGSLRAGGASGAAEASGAGEAGVHFALQESSETLSGEWRGGRPLFHQGQVCAYEEGEGLCLRDGSSEVRLRDGSHDVLVRVHLASIEEPSFFVQRTLAAALFLALRPFGLFHLHAAALCSPSGRSLLVCGTAGAGKSTTAISLMEGGYACVTDDMLLVARRPGPRLLAFPRSFHVGPKTVAAFPRLAPHVGAPYRRFSDKRPLDAQAAYPGQLVQEAGAPSAFFFSALDGAGPTRLEPLDGAHTLGLLVEAGAWLVADGVGQKEEQLQLLQALANGGRGYRLHLGPDALERPETLRALVGEVLS